ncbi:sulfotransferase ssu-1-like [Ixodes scapularis]|uniref:sulfotransferase ssu-1-like n=1 Tax=Ixodes scapularis TaxID=6945 RepID=UPI001C391D05|nr:sulfotransferase ssu-1-like [Ixodes scapularis]
MSAAPNVNVSSLFKNLDGFYMSIFLDENTVQSAMSYKPRSDDIFIVTYPKCGTTWTQYIVHCILYDGVLPKDFTEFFLRSPWLEFLGSEAAEKMVRPGTIKCHLPLHKLPYSENAKYIFVVRNPYDVSVSFYHHSRGIPNNGLEDAPFDTFLDLFLSGQVRYGDYFDHLLSLYKHRNNSNVLFFRYEDLQKDIKAWVLKIADFLGEEYGQKLRHDNALLDKVVKATSFESLNKTVNDGVKTLMHDLFSLPPERQFKSLQVYSQRFGGRPKLELKHELLRKGVIGDYKNLFSAEQIRRMKERIASKTKGSDVMNLWIDIGLP